MQRLKELSLGNAAWKFSAGLIVVMIFLITMVIAYRQAAASSIAAPVGNIDANRTNQTPGLVNPEVFMSRTQIWSGVGDGIQTGIVGRRAPKPG